MRNLSLLTDLYQLTMLNGYYLSGKREDEAVFDLFFRNNGFINYAIAAGLEQACDYINNLKFSKEDIGYLRSLNLFAEEFLEYLAAFKFNGSIYSVPEGTVVFPNEPILIVKANLLEAQLIETALLNIINHQTLIATKAAVIAYAAEPAQIVEFGLRRAQGPDAAIYGARASIIGGAVATSNVFAAKEFGLKAAGTMAHSFIMSFETEYAAFMHYAKSYPDSCTLLVDTYDTLKSGVPNAIKVFKNLREQGFEPIGIRLDSGDLAYLSKQSRKMLDDAGFEKVIIMASGDIDENVIHSLKYQDAKIDSYGVGTKLIVSAQNPALGGVYKLGAIRQKDGEFTPKMKFSDNIEKMTNPGFKQVVRLYQKDTGKALADLIMLKSETMPLPRPLTLTHPVQRFMTKTIEEFDERILLEPIFEQGKMVYKLPTLSEICQYAAKEKSTLWEEYKRSDHPHIYKVDLSDELYSLKESFLIRKK